MQYPKVDRPVDHSSNCGLLLEGSVLLRGTPHGPQNASLEYLLSALQSQGDFSSLELEAHCTLLCRK
jgi:hypothetical protein